MTGDRDPETCVALDLEVGELLEFHKAGADEGFVLVGDSLRRHYFYFTSDRRHVVYDGYSDPQ